MSEKEAKEEMRNGRRHRAGKRMRKRGRGH